MPKDFDFEIDLGYGRAGENLAYGLADRLISNDEDDWPMVFTATPRVKRVAQALASHTYNGRVDQLGKPSLLDRVFAKDYLSSLIDAPVPVDHPWFQLMKQGDPFNTATRDYDFIYLATRYECKHEGACFGHTRDKNFPTWNVCFEVNNQSTGAPSGVYKNHDIFCLVVDNRQGQPILVTYDRTDRLRRFVEAWKDKATLIGGENDNSKMVLVWLPYYLSGTLPNTLKLAEEPLVAVEDGY